MVFLLDWSMFAVLATKPLLLGPEPIAVPETVPAGNCCMWGFESCIAPPLTEPACPGAWPAGSCLAPPWPKVTVCGTVLAAAPYKSSTFMVFACFFLWPGAAAGAVCWTWLCWFRLPMNCSWAVCVLFIWFTPGFSRAKSPSSLFALSIFGFVLNYRLTSAPLSCAPFLVPICWCD